MAEAQNFSADDERIVGEMIDRLRDLQGIAEGVPPLRRVSAGAGLTGGGTLANDVTLALDGEMLAAVRALVSRGGAASLVTDKELGEALAGYVAAGDVVPHIVSHDFSVVGSPSERIVSAPLVFTKPGVLRNVVISCREPGARQVTVTFNGEQFVLMAGQQYVVLNSSRQVQTSRAYPLTVNATDAADILVSLRIEER